MNATTSPFRAALGDRDSELRAKYERRSDDTTDAVLDQVGELVARAAATGLALNRADDRRAVQALLAHWAAVRARHGAPGGAELAPFEPFPTRDAVQAEHTALLKRYADQRKEPGAVAGLVYAFVMRAAATGVALEPHRDRQAVQSLIDYWVTVLYRFGEEVEATLLDCDKQWGARELTGADYPYPRPGQSDTYFDRPEVLTTCLKRLAEPPHLLIVSGAVGSGRSALVRSALVPALELGTHPHAGGKGLRVLPMATPGEHPSAAIDALVAALAPTSALPAGKRATKGPRLLAAARAAGRKPVVVVVDQVEELLTRCKDEGERRAFVAELRELVQANDHPAWVVLIVLREDKDKLVAALGLNSALVARADYPVPMISAGELRAAIVPPAERVGLRFEPGLVERIVGDLVGHPTPLLLLRFILELLWERKKKNVLTEQAYHEIGRTQAVNTAAEQTYRALREKLNRPEGAAGAKGDRAEAVVKRLFLRLIRTGVSAEDLIPTPTTRKELVREDDDRAAVDAFAAAGLIRVRRAARPDDDVLEPVYLPLVVQWEQLGKWLQKDRQESGVRSLLTKAAQEWQRLNFSPKALWRGELLAKAVALTDRTALENDFVVASQAAQAAADRRRMWGLVGLGLLLTAAALGWGYMQRELKKKEELATKQERQAKEQEQRAAREQRLLTDVAQSQGLAAAADNLGGSQLDLRLRLGLEAFEPHGTAAKDVDPGERAKFVALARPDVEGTLFRAVEANPRLHRFLHGHTGPVFAAAYSRNGRVLATAGVDERVLLWDPDRPYDPARYPHTADDKLTAGAGIRCLAFGPDRLAAGTTAGTVALWSFPGYAPLESIRLPDDIRGEKRTIRCLAFSPDGTKLATGGWDGMVRLWDVRNPRAPQPIGDPQPISWRGPDGADAKDAPDTGPRVAVNAVAFSPSDGTLAAAGTGRAEENDPFRRVHVWTVTDAGLKNRTLVGKHSDYVTALAYSPDGKLASADGSGWVQVRVLGAPDAVELGPPLPPAPVTALAFGPGSTLAIADVSGRVRLHRVVPSAGKAPSASDVPGGPLLGHGGGVWAMAFRPGAAEPQLVTTGADGRVVLWNPVPHEPTQVELGPEARQPVTATTLSGDGQRLAVARRDGRLSLWDPATRTQTALLATDGPAVIALASVSARGAKLLASADVQGGVAVWDLTADSPTRKPMPNRLLYDAARFRTVPRPLGVAFNPDGTLLAAWTMADPAIWLWPHAEKGGPAHRLGLAPNHVILGAALAVEERPNDGPRPLLFVLLRSPAVANRHPEVLRWDVSDPAKPVPLPFEQRAFVEKAETLAVSPDGRRIAVGTVPDDVTGVAYILSGAVTEKQWAGLPLAVPSGQRRHENRIERLEFTADGKWLVSADSIGRLGRWDAEKGSVFGEHEQTPDTRGVRGVGAADASGRLVVASGGEDATVRLWRFPPSGDVAGVREDRLPRGSIEATAFRLGPDRPILAAGLDTGDVLLWDLRARTALGKPLPTESRSAVTCVALGPARLAAGTADGTVVWWDSVDPGATRRAGKTEWQPADGVLAGVAFSPDGALVAAASTKGRVRVWDAASGQERGAYTPAGGADSRQQRVAFWDLARDFRRYSDLMNRDTLSGALAFRPGGGLAVNLPDSSLRLLETSASGPPREASELPREASGRVRALAFHPSGQLLAAGGVDDVIRLWDTRDPRRPAPLPLVVREHQSAVQAIAFSRDGRLMASAELRGTRIYLWRVELGTGPDGGLSARVVLLGKAPYGSGGQIIDLAFDHASERLWWATADGKVGDLDVALESWKRRAADTANRFLKEDEKTRYLLPPPTAP